MLCPLLLVTVACGSRVKVQSGSGSAANGAAAAGGDADQGVSPKEQVAERDREIERLRNEVQALREHENQMRASLGRASGGGAGDTGAAGSPGTAGSDEGAARGGSGAAAGSSRSDVVVAALRAALSQEQERRLVVETELTRLKEETSASPYGGPRVPEADFLAVKQEVVELQKALADERSAREHMSADVQHLQGNGVPPVPAAADTSAESADLRARLQSLQEERDAIVESLNRNLVASQQRAAELEQQLATARSAATPTTADSDGAAAAAHAESTSLRAQLDEERHRAEDLAAKLKVATRVTDLIFKIQAQQAKTQAAPKKRRRH
jgi:hypothetical protein